MRELKTFFCLRTRYNDQVFDTPALFRPWSNLERTFSPEIPPEEVKGEGLTVWEGGVTEAGGGSGHSGQVARGYYLPSTPT